MMFFVIGALLTMSPEGIHEGGDTTPPDAVADLAIAPGWNIPGGTRLLCTAPGDDGDGGGACAEYSVRYSVGAAITDETGWNAATPLPFGGLSDVWRLNIKPAGEELNIEVTSNPAPGQAKYIAIRFRDGAGNVGGISNNAVWDEQGDS